MIRLAAGMAAVLLAVAADAKTKRFAQWDGSGPLVAFSPASRARPYLTGDGVPLVDPGISLPVYVQNPPGRRYDVIGYVRMSDAPEGAQPRWYALQQAAECARRHGGTALYLVEPRWGEYMIAAVLKWSH